MGQAIDVSEIPIDTNQEYRKFGLDHDVGDSLAALDVSGPRVGAERILYQISPRPLLQTCEICWNLAIFIQEAKKGLDHGVGHPVPIALPHGSSRWIEGRWRELNRCPNCGK